MDTDHQAEVTRPWPPARLGNSKRWLALGGGIAAAILFLAGLYLEMRH
jgi:hypothetical protein